MTSWSGEDISNFDSKTLSEFLDMGGPELRDALVAQVRQDLDRCQAELLTALALPETDRDIAAMGKYAHEIKGLGATIGAMALADLAGQLEQACQGHATAGLTALATRLAHDTERTSAALAVLAPSA